MPTPIKQAAEVGCLADSWHLPYSSVCGLCLQDAQWCAAFIRYLTEAYAADLLGGNHDPQRWAIFNLPVHQLFVYSRFYYYRSYYHMLIEPLSYKASVSIYTYEPTDGFGQGRSSGYICRHI